jgi:hypothetical protein
VSDLVPLGDLPAARAGVEPAPTGLPSWGKVEFIMFGYTAPDGTVQLWVSRDVREVTITPDGPDYEDVTGSWGRERIYSPRASVTLGARLDSISWVGARSFRDALADLVAQWRP